MFLDCLVGSLAFLFTKNQHNVSNVDKMEVLSQKLALGRWVATMQNYFHVLDTLLSPWLRSTSEDLMLLFSTLFQLKQRWYRMHWFIEIRILKSQHVKCVFKRTTIDIIADALLLTNTSTLDIRATFRQRCVLCRYAFHDHTTTHNSNNRHRERQEHNMLFVVRESWKKVPLVRLADEEPYDQFTPLNWSFKLSNLIITHLPNLSLLQLTQHTFSWMYWGFKFLKPWILLTQDSRLT
jgi:hypothetical protein